MYGPSTATREESSGSDANRVRRYGSGLVGFGVVAVAAVSFAPVLVGLAGAFAEFSATALVFGLAALWALVWIGVETVWERRARRGGRGRAGARN
jgi:hypothetical protein